MTSRKTYNVEIAPNDTTYGAVITAAAPFAAMLGLVLQAQDVSLEEPGQQVLAAMQPHLIRIEEILEWPGNSQLPGKYKYIAVRYLYRIEQAAINALFQETATLDDWLNPTRPEDVHLLRDDGSTVLGTVSAHDDVWLELDDDEYTSLLHELPQLADRTSLYEP
jgi:hypothetical protein